MSSLAQLGLAAAAFFFLHFLSSTPLRPVLVRAMGEWPYRGLYSAIAFASLVWLGFAYGAAPREVLWEGPRWLPMPVLAVAFVLMTCGYFRNPMIVGAEKLMGSPEPARGIVRITRHPIMWAVILWALSHVIAYGTVKGLILFGTLFAVAAIGTVSMDSRKKSNPDFARFAAVTSNSPFVAIAQGRNRLVWREIGFLLPGLGFGVYALFFVLHPWLFGSRPY